MSSYEEFVRDPESQARRVLDWCGLPWQASVLEFHAQATTFDDGERDAGAQTDLHAFDRRVAAQRGRPRAGARTTSSARVY